VDIKKSHCHFIPQLKTNFSLLLLLTMSGYTYVMHDSDDSSALPGLECMCCLSTLNHPVMHACGKMFCIRCAHETYQSSSTARKCPHCKEPFWMQPVPYYIHEHILGALLVRCLRCKAEMKCVDYTGHYNEKCKTTHEPRIGQEVQAFSPATGMTGRCFIVAVCDDTKAVFARDAVHGRIGSFNGVVSQTAPSNLREWAREHIAVPRRWGPTATTTQARPPLLVNPPIATQMRAGWRSVALAQTRLDNTPTLAQVREEVSADSLGIGLASLFETDEDWLA
jgi:hypothetical protein